MASSSVGVRSAEALDGLRVELKVAMDRIPGVFLALQTRATKTYDELVARRRRLQRSAEEATALILLAGRADPPARDYAAERALRQAEEQMAAIDSLRSRLGAAAESFTSARVRTERLLMDEGPKAAELLGQLSADVQRYSSSSFTHSKLSAPSPTSFSSVVSPHRLGGMSAGMAGLLAGAIAVGLAARDSVESPAPPDSGWSEVHPLDPAVVAATGAISGWRSAGQTVLILEAAAPAEAARRAAATLRDPVTIVAIRSGDIVTAYRSDGEDRPLVEVVPEFVLSRGAAPTSEHPRDSVAAANLRFVAVGDVDLDWPEQATAELVVAAARVPEIQAIIERGGSRQILQLADRLDGHDGVDGAPGLWERAYDLFFGGDHIVVETLSGRYRVIGGHQGEELVAAARAAGLTQLPVEVAQ